MKLSGTRGAESKRESMMKVADDKRETLRLEHAHAALTLAFGEDLHSARVASLANGVVGVMLAARLSIHAIGHAYAALAHIQPKSAIKQVDRLLSNAGMDLDTLLGAWVRHVVGEHPSVIVAIDWTEFAKDDHTTLCAYMITTHGRALPLAWRTLKKSELKGKQTETEEALIKKLHEWLPPQVGITVLADRGFGRAELYRLLDSLHWDYVIRFRQIVKVEHEGETVSAVDLVAPAGRAQMFHTVNVTSKRVEVPAIVTVKAKAMKEPWCLATSLSKLTPREVVKLYGRRFTIEEAFRDTKDLHFGMGLSATHIRSAERRDRLLLLVAVGHTLLSLLGAASEEAGLDAYMKANTEKKRTHSLYRQGEYWFRWLPTMREDWFGPLMIAFDRIVSHHPFISYFFAQTGPLFHGAK